MSLKRILKLKSGVSWLLCLQMILVPVLPYAQAASSSSPMEQLAATEGPGAGEADPVADERLGEHSVYLHQQRDAILSGRYAEVSPELIDPQGLANQEVVYYEKGKAGDPQKFTDENARFKDPGATQFKFEIRNGKLILFGYRGLEAIAAQVFQGISEDFVPVAVKQDQELVTVLDQKGRISVIDLGLVKLKAFQMPIPRTTVFDGGESLRSDSGNLEIAYYNRGLKPFTREEIEKSGYSRETVIPRDINGRPMFKDGDIVIFERGESGERKLIGIYSREATHEIVSQGLKAFSWLTIVSNLEGMTPDFDEALQKLLEITGEGTGKSPVEDLLDQIVKEEDQRRYDELIERIKGLEINPLVAMAIKNVDRAGLRAAVGQSKLNKDLKLRETDQVNLQQMERSYEMIVAKAEREIQILDEAQKTAKSVSAKEEIKAHLLRLKSQYHQQDFSVDHRKLFAGATKEESLYYREKLPWYRSLKREQVIKVAKIIAGISVLAGFNSAMDYGQKIVDGVKEVGAETYLLVNWVFDFIPDHLKEQWYRVPLILSVTSQLMIIPLVQFAGMVSVKPMKLISLILSKSSNSTLANAGSRWLENIEKFEDADTYQRIVTIGNRAYAFIIRYLDHIEASTRQNFVHSLQAGVNPLSVVSGRSNIGKRAGLAENESVIPGFNNPFQSRQSLQETRGRQEAVLKAIKGRKLEAHKLAWQMANVIAAEKFGVDAALITMLQTEQIKIHELRTIMTDSAKRRAWQLTARHLQMQIAHLAFSKDIDVSDLKNEEVARLFLSAEATAKEILESQSSRSGQLRNALISAKLSSSGMGLSILQTLVNLGLKEANFLRKVVASKFVAGRVKKEFTGDHIMVVAIPALGGARADLSHPEHLMAQADGIFWTNPAHVYEIILNTYAHLVSAGSGRVMVFQTPKPTIDGNYDPIEREIFHLQKRTVPWYRELWSWPQLLNTKESNIGSYYVRGFSKRLRTIQVALLIGLVGRMAVAGQPIEMAVMAALIMFFASEFSFAWPWTLLNRGSQIAEEKIEGNVKEVMENIERMSRSLRSGQTSHLRGEYARLLRFYRVHADTAFGPLKSELEKSESALKMAGRLKFNNEDYRRMREVFQQEDIENLMHLLARLRQAREAGDLLKTESLHLSIREFIESKGEASSQIAEIYDALEEKSKTMIEFTFANSPVFTETNQTVNSLVTFGAGPILTTALFLSLAVSTFTASYVVLPTLLYWTGASALGYSTLFLLGSKKSGRYFSNLYETKIRPKLLHPRTEKTVADPQVRALSRRERAAILRCEAALASGG